MIKLSYANLISTTALLVACVHAALDIVRFQRDNAGYIVNIKLDHFEIGTENSNLVISAQYELAVSNRSNKDLQIVECLQITPNAAVGLGQAPYVADCPKFKESTLTDGGYVVPQGHTVFLDDSYTLSIPISFASEMLRRMDYMPDQITSLVAQREQWSVDLHVFPTGSGVDGHHELQEGQELFRIRLTSGDGRVETADLLWQHQQNWPWRRVTFEEF